MRGYVRRKGLLPLNIRRLGFVQLPCLAVIHCFVEPSRSLAQAFSESKGLSRVWHHRGCFTRVVVNPRKVHVSISQIRVQFHSAFVLRKCDRITLFVS